MKCPAKIFALCSTMPIKDSVEYIRRDVAIKGMQMTELDVIDRYGDVKECNFEEILNSVIEDADKERSEDK